MVALVMCVLVVVIVRRRKIKQRVQSPKETVTNQVELTYEGIPGPTGSTGHKISTGHTPITNMAKNPAYEAVKRDQAQKRHN